MNTLAYTLSDDATDHSESNKETPREIGNFHHLHQTFNSNLKLKSTG